MIKKHDKTDYTANDKIQLSNYSALSIWSEIEFLINNVTIERINNPYYGSLMQKIASDTNNDALSGFTIENSATTIDEYLNKLLIDSSHELVLRLKISDVLGYLKTHKIFFGARISFNFTRADDNMIAYRTMTGDSYSVEIKNVRMYITQSRPYKELFQSVDKQISSMKSITYPYLHKSIAAA